MVLLLLAAAAVYAAVGNVTDAAVSLVALVAITLVTFVLEQRTERALGVLRDLASPTARVWRDGTLRVVPARELVPGDLVEVREGDILPADGVAEGGMLLKTDESSLTGESQPVDRAQGDPLFAGTTVLAGRGRIVIQATGAATRYGRIGTLLARIDEPASPLLLGIRRLVLTFGVVAIACCLAVAGFELARGGDLAGALVAGISLAIATIPEELPMVFTLYMSLGAWRLARERALIRRLPKVETLGATTVIATDKTGTLTTGRVELVALVDAAGQAVSGDAARELIRVAALASDRDGHDPLDDAIFRFVPPGLDAAQGLILSRSHPFDAAGRHVSQAWLGDGASRIFAKGALEPMLDRVGADAATRASAEAANARLAAKGMRVLALAASDPGPLTGDRAADERGLRYRGLVAFADPIREGVREALEECRGAGVRVIMMTGDHPLTAQAVGTDLGFTGEAIVGGAVLDKSDGEVEALVGAATIFARMEADEKHRLVRALHARHEVVAMTGDGTNDAPALREADIGIAMGRRGTDVARSAATLVLLDDNFATIVRAIREGRRIFENIRRAFAYLVAFHVPLLLVALVVPLAGAPLMLLPVHLVWLEIIVHPTASLVFEADPAEADLMRRPPRPVAQELIAPRALVRPLALGTTLALAVLAIYLGALDQGRGEAVARALAIATLISGQLMLALVARSPARPLWRAAYATNRSLWPVLGACAAGLLAAVYLPGLRDVLALAPIGAGELLAAGAAAAVATLWSEPFKGRSRHVNSAA